MSIEFEYHDPSRRGKVIVAIGLILAVVAGGAAYFLVSQASRPARRTSRRRRSSWPRKRSRVAR